MAWPAFANRLENPYNALLYSALRDLDVEVVEFSVQRLLFGPRADILHIHWAPTNRIRGAKRAVVKRTSAEMLWLLSLARRRGMKVVWTAHNVTAHDKREHPDLEKKYWPMVADRLSAVISLSKSGTEVLRDRHPPLATVPAFVSRHGSYRGAYPRDLSPEKARTALGIPTDAKVLSFVGQVRPYKNLPALLRAFSKVDDPNAVLLIAGKLKLYEHSAEFEDLVARDARVKVFREFVPADKLQLYLNAADLVVLPFRETLNSGSAILGLSFDRPVLVPGHVSLVELAREIGGDWIMTYDGELTPDILIRSLDRSLSMRGATAPLESLEWPLIARQTRDIYRSLLG
ncbi:MAG: glycosyltransferase [Gemmatimonadales bacterium]